MHTLPILLLAIPTQQTPPATRITQNVPTTQATPLIRPDSTRPIDYILDFDIDDRGRIGVYSSLEDRACVAFFDPDGSPVIEFPLALAHRRGISMFRYAGRDRWIVFANSVRADVSSEVWLIEPATRRVALMVKLPGHADSIAGDRAGGFVIYQTISRPAGDLHLFEHGEIVAYDARGAERLRVIGDHGDPARRLPFAAAITVTSDGRIVLLDQNNQNLLIFAPDGTRMGTRPSGEFRYCMPSANIISPDLGGGVVVVRPYGDQYPVCRVSLAPKFISPTEESLKNSLPSLPTTSTRPYYDGTECHSAIDHMGGRITPFRGARVAPDGRIWVCDCRALYRIDSSGHADRVLGAPSGR